VGREIEKSAEQQSQAEFRSRAEVVLRHARQLSARCKAALQALYDREKKQDESPARDLSAKRHSNKT
jgi:transposase